MPNPTAALALSADDAESIRLRLHKAVAHRLPAALRGMEDDLVQIAHMRVLRKLSEPGAVVNARYLDRVAYCVVVDEWRRRREELAPESDAADDAVSTASNPEDHAHSRRLGRAIADCLSAMVPARQSAVGLYLEGHSVPQAAQMLGYSAKKAENLVYRGLKDLRRCLEGKGVEP